MPETLCPAREITCQATCQLRGVAGAPELGQSGNRSNTEAWGVPKKWRAGKKSWNRLQIEGKHGVSHASESFPSGHQVPPGGKGRERQRVSSKETLDKAQGENQQSQWLLAVPAWCSDNLKMVRLQSGHSQVTVRSQSGQQSGQQSGHCFLHIN